MASDTAVQPSQVEVVGLHPRFSRLLVVRVALEPPPTAGWHRHFEQAVDPEGYVPIHTPLVQDAAVLLAPPDADLAREVAHLERRIRIANETYAVERLAMARPTPSDAERARLEAARQRAARISASFAVRP